MNVKPNKQLFSLFSVIDDRNYVLRRLKAEKDLSDVDEVIGTVRTAEVICAGLLKEPFCNHASSLLHKRCER